MKIAIFCTSNDTSDFARRHITDDIKYINLLKPLRPDWQFDCFAVWQDEFPKDIQEYDGVIMTGSPASVHDEEPWICKLLDLIRKMHSLRIPMFGGCFGQQAIALALGGQVEKNIKGGWSMGKEKISFHHKPAFLSEIKDELEVYSIHKEEVTKLPEGAQSIGTNSYCKYPAFVMGDHIFATQYHPEMTQEFLHELTDEMAGTLPETLLEKARRAFAEGHDGNEFALAIVAFFEFSTRSSIGTPARR